MKTFFEIPSFKRTHLLLFSLYLSFLTNVHITEAARILAMFASPAPSHNIMFQALMRALAERGHSVEVASSYTLPSPKPENYTDVTLPIPNFDRSALLKTIVSSEITPLKEHLALWSLAETLCEVHLSSPELQKYLSPDYESPKFDLVIVEVFFFDCLVGFAHHFDVPLIGMVSQFALPWSNDLVANPKSFSTVPNIFLHYGLKMSFLERLHNTLFTLGVTMYRRFISLPKQNEIAKRYFGPDMPPLWEIEKKTSLVLSNGHPVVSPIHPTMPNMVEVAGMHISANPPPLPKNIQQIMDKNKKVILFSLGSVIGSSTIQEERLITLLSAFKEMPCQVIWRWDGDTKKLPLPLPPNVHAHKWLPQQSLLAHPNLVAFVTHGGLLSIQEATYHGVPIIGFPFFGDQFLNLRHASERGIGFILSFFSLTKEELVNAVNKILSDPSYKVNSKKLSSIFKDQPETPVERGVYWTEYVLRHNGAPHLRSGAMDLNWFQYCLLDVIAFLLFSLIAFCIIFYYICAFFKSLLFGKQKKSKED